MTKTSARIFSVLSGLPVAGTCQSFEVTVKFSAKAFLLMMVLLLSPSMAYAWHPAQVPGPGYYPGAQYYPPYGFGYGPYPYHYGYTGPRMYMRGFIDRNGEYRIDVRLRNLSQYDLYNAWWLYQQLGNR